MTRSAAAVAAIRRVLAALDYGTLGRVYCDHGGTAFWADRRAPVLELGLRWAEELAARVPPGGTSLYVGAGVAELPVMIAETIDLGRKVIALNRRGDECAVLNRALAAEGVPLRLVDADAREAAQPCDHVGLVSVLCDPETFPTVSGITYGRLHPVHLDVAALHTEQEAVRGLVDAVLGGLVLPGWVTTTVEEVPWILAWAAGHGVRAVADDTLVPTAVVGDPLGFLRLVADRPDEDGARAPGRG